MVSPERGVVGGNVQHVYGCFEKFSGFQYMCAAAHSFSAQLTLQVEVLDRWPLELQHPTSCPDMIHESAWTAVL